MGDANCLLFQDLPNDRTMRWIEGQGVSVYRAPSQYANGQTRDRQARRSFETSTRASARASWGITHLSSKPLIRVPNDFVRSSPSSERPRSPARSPQMRSEDQGRRRLSRESLAQQGTLPFSRWLVDGSEDRGRPQAHCGCTTAQVGRLSSKHKQATLAVHLAPDRPFSPLAIAFAQTAGGPAFRDQYARVRIMGSYLGLRLATFTSDNSSSHWRTRPGQSGATGRALYAA